MTQHFRTQDHANAPLCKPLIFLLCEWSLDFWLLLLDFSCVFLFIVSALCFLTSSCTFLPFLACSALTCASVMFRRLRSVNIALFAVSVSCIRNISLLFHADSSSSGCTPSSSLGISWVNRSVFGPALLFNAKNFCVSAILFFLFSFSRFFCLCFALN